MFARAQIFTRDTRHALMALALQGRDACATKSSIEKSVFR